VTFDPRLRLLALLDALGELLIAAGLPERTRSLSRPFRLQVSIPAAELSAIRVPIAVQAAPRAGLRLRLSIATAEAADGGADRTVELSPDLLAHADAVTFNFAPLPSTLAGETLLELTFESAAEPPPTLRLLPRKTERVLDQLEHGNLAIKVSLFSTPSDVAFMTKMANRFILGLLGALLGIISVMLLSTNAGPVLADGVELLHILGAIGLAAGVILILRVVAAIARDGLN